MDLLILHVLRDRGKFRQLRHTVPDDMVGQETVAMLAWFEQFFRVFPEKDYVDTESLRSLFNVKVGAGISEDQRAVMQMLFRKLDEPVDVSAAQGITTELYHLDFKGKAAALINRYDNGEEVDLTYELGRLAQDNTKRVAASVPASFIDASIEDILKDFEGDRGLKMVTELLRSSVGGLQGGDSVIVAARVDAGKSSLLAANLTHFAKQLKSMGWEGRPMLWLSNEGSGRRLIPRIYQAALKCTFEEMVQKSKAGTLTDEYNKAMGGECIRVKDVHGMTLGQIEMVVQELNPCVVVFDMLANVRLSKGTGSAVDDLERLFQEVREMAVLHDFVAVSAVQVSVEGDDTLYPPASALKGSKTGIQGAVDVILMMGRLNSLEMDEVRGFSTPKNKRQMHGKPSNTPGTVFFDKQRCQFTDG